MASIFTFDPDPPRVASPWSTPPAATPREQHGIAHKSIAQHKADSASDVGSNGTAFTHDGGLALTKLEAEPQDGPTEYKLHLLLRPRRSFVRTSTGRHIPGSYRERAVSLNTTNSMVRRVSDSFLGGDVNVTPLTSTLASSQARQHRLVQLTTQLLWRLQQSSPYHTSAATNLVLPQLPQVSALQPEPAAKLGNIIPGLEESKGALYEIGVSDDGTLVGLAEDELEESLTNLRAMATSLGCSVQVLRKVAVGDCEWYETIQSSNGSQQRLRSGTLWVAEVLVKPATHNVESPPAPAARADSKDNQVIPQAIISNTLPSKPGDDVEVRQQTEQLRVTLTGATMSGKSSLLGSLSTATLDNGRGKSRLSLLKHRHEIASGMTSSVTQELVGYVTAKSPSHSEAFDVINYASDNVSAWTDVHQRVEGGRLVFLSDSAGHLRYRRTTVRGLIGWAPHWTLLCIPADNVEDTSGKSGSTPSSQEVLGALAADVDLSQMHLELCIKLNLPLVIVVTKFDIASNSGLKKTLAKPLSALKAASRKPVILRSTATNVQEEDLLSLPHEDIEDVRRVVSQLQADPTGIVPILLTSAVSGSGITKLHALLRELPITISIDAAVSSRPPPLFHVEDVYNKLVSSKPAVATVSSGSVISGYLRYGTINVGDELVLGPYPTEPLLDDSSANQSDSTSPPRGSPGRRPNHAPASRSFPGALHKSAMHPIAKSSKAIWRRVTVVSIRNLRLPVRTLRADQVGTIGIEPVSEDEPIVSPSIIRIRKGMVLAGNKDGLPKATRLFTARFNERIVNVGVGSAVVVYVASVRASVKVLAVSMPKRSEVTTLDDEDGFGFGFDAQEDSDEEQRADHEQAGTRITFQFLAAKEYIEAGSQVLLMPGGGPLLAGGTERGEKGVAGLEGYVGIVEQEDH